MVVYKLLLGKAEIELRLYRRGRSRPFSDWLASLKDARAAAIVRSRLNRLRLGNFGDCKSVGGGVEELRIDFGPGYRVCFGRDGLVVVILLSGGDKKSQARDILAAQQGWKECLDAKSEG